MLGALIKQAEQANLVIEPGFAPKEIHWLVNIHKGEYKGVISRKNGKKGDSYAKCPELSQPELIGLPKALGQSQAAHFLADTCGVVTLLPALDREGQPKTDDKSQKDLAKATEKHTTFLELLHRAGQSVPQCLEIAEVLSDPQQLEQLRTSLIAEKAKPTEKISFRVNQVDLLDNDCWHDWWRIFRQGTFAKAKNKAGMRDFTSGELVTPAKTHPKLTKLGVGAISSGASLVGYDKDAFASYGLKSGENGVVSEANAAAYRAALENLLNEAPTLGQMKVVAWFDRYRLEGNALIGAITDPESLEEEESFDLDNWDETKQPEISSSPKQQKAVAKERVRKILEAIRTGETPEQLKAKYFALALSGASGRAMVRDWQTGDLDHLAQAVAQWFEDLAIVGVSGKRANKPKFYSLLMNIQRAKATTTSLDDYLKPIRNLQLPLWRAALDPKAPIPFTALAKLMEAHKAHVMTGKFAEALSREGSGVEKSRVYIRMAIIKAYHLRKVRNQQGGYSMKQDLDPNHPNTAYHCGRLMYLLVNLQNAQSQGREINAGVEQRYYGAASSTPALVLGRLTRLSKHHLAKLSRDKPGLAFTLEKEIAEVWLSLGHSLPKTLSLEEQSFFAMGYYQQLAHNTQKRIENKAKNSNETTQTEEGA